VISASEKDCLDLFISARGRIGSVEQNIEKDFWVCWILDALFNGLQPGGPRLLFKGGTSLSKGFGLIARFSEDIDITVFRKIQGNRQRLKNWSRLAARSVLTARSVNRLQCCSARALEDSNLAPENGRVEPDPNDPDQQSLLL
jgi:hypothetical protein